MTFSGRIRLYLIAIAVVPPLAILAVMFISARSAETRLAEQIAADATKRGCLAVESLKQRTMTQVTLLAASAQVRKAVDQFMSGRAPLLRDDRSEFGVAFCEIVSSGDTVIATAHRPGLVGERLKRSAPPSSIHGPELTVEYDAGGAHIALSARIELRPGLSLYAGQYLDSVEFRLIEQTIGAGVFAEKVDEKTQSAYRAMEPGQLYKAGDSLIAVLLASPDQTTFIIAGFPKAARTPFAESLLTITALVTIVAVAAAIGLGILFTSRTKREIDNLVDASRRVASGDFDTSVMAYEPGEFAYLADSFSEMIHRLRMLQGRLATSEKIAAWQTIGRKIAHEIKNPLTPIGLAADDLRRSYHDKSPDFDKILDEQTATIRSEVNRLLSILQEFVDFARMKPPQFDEVPLEPFLAEIGKLYSEELSTGRLVIDNSSHQQSVRIDSELIRQLVINLVKNGFESRPSANVTVTAYDDGDELVMTVEDDGPGFSEERLKNAFEPYSTTKKDGSGLGLVISHRIAYDHGGNMELYNREQGGAGVRITLPRERRG